MKGNIIFTTFLSVLLAYHFERFLRFSQGEMLSVIGPILLFLIASVMFFGISVLLDFGMRKTQKNAHKKIFGFLVIFTTILGILLFVLKPLVIYSNLSDAEKMKNFPLRNPYLMYYYIETLILRGLAILFVGSWILIRFNK